MKPLNLIALLLFLAGTMWALTRSERSVQSIQAAYYKAISPCLKPGSVIEQYARAYTHEVQHSRVLEKNLDTANQNLGRLQILETRYRALENENAELRHALEFKKASRFEVVAANITHRNPSTWWQTVEIDVGKKRGVTNHLAVLSNDGLVGKITRVDDTGDRSAVILLTDEKCQVSVRVEGSPEVGIASGQRGATQGEPMLRLRFLSPNTSVRPGQRVLTTGRGGIFQANILLGTIQSVERRALDSEALIRPSVNFADLGAVFVVLTTEN